MEFDIGRAVLTVACFIIGLALDTAFVQVFAASDEGIRALVREPVSMLDLGLTRNIGFHWTEA